jgi:small GTP-binding protein
MQKKICLLGPFAVGKSSLIRRFVDSIFSDKYLTTIGVKIDKKALTIESKDVNLMIWDIEGEDDYTDIKASYLRGASGYILVADGTRQGTVGAALNIHYAAQKFLTRAPAVMALNKADLIDQWTVTDEQIGTIHNNLTMMHTSAKSGDNVEALFTSLTLKMLEGKVY